MRYHKLPDLSNRNLVSHNFGGWKAKIKVLVRFFQVCEGKMCSRPLSLACIGGLHFHMVSSLYACLCQISPFLKITSHTALESRYICNDPVSK